MITRTIIWIAMEDETTAAELLRIARRHCKLVLEYGRANTSPERREVIRDEISQLKAERNNLLSIAPDSNI